MADPYVAAATIALMGVIAAGLIAGFFGLRRDGSNMKQSANGFLGELRATTAAIKDSAQALNALHEDMRDVLRENREAHAAIEKALIRLLERGSKP